MQNLFLFNFVFHYESGSFFILINFNKIIDNEKIGTHIRILLLQLPMIDCAEQSPRSINFSN